jgi:hypothetical protein
VSDDPPEWIRESLDEIGPGGGIGVTTADGRYYSGALVSYRDGILTLAIGANVQGPPEAKPANPPHRRIRVEEIRRVVIAWKIVETAHTL